MTTAHSAIALRITVGELASKLGAELSGPASLTIERLDTLDRADERTLTFIRDERFAARWEESRAGAAIVTRGVEPHGHDPSRRALLVVDDADRALIAVLETLAPAHAGPPAGVHATAVVDPSAQVDPSARIGPRVVIGAGSWVGAGATLHAGVVLGAGAVIGEACDLRSGVVVEDRCVLGARVIVHPNAVIGADGFGYRPGTSPDGGKALLKVPHAGAVQVGDDVEIGACTTIDRGKLGPTVVGAGTKIDNLVQVGHNCVIGRMCVICGAVGLAGSVTLGDGVTLGGGVGVKDGVTIGAGSMVAARAAVMDDIPPGQAWAGYPARPVKETMRIVAATSKLPDLLRELRSASRMNGATEGA